MTRDEALRYRGYRVCKVESQPAIYVCVFYNTFPAFCFCLN